MRTLKSKSLFCLFLLPLISWAQLGNTLHCGFDFTTYLVVDVKDAATQNNVTGLRLSIVDDVGNEVLNTNNQHSFLNANVPLVFSENYKIDSHRWFFPYA
ncbi:hypothetical protein K5I29_01510 [Flavobacterium agricola]|uniref:Uncharacterized protein n=1 Tax=Flavobacterium agricola TaxID=2870839 RepID=A0ABY6M1W2_9FLAO|nr:hypothetical protein [Flavobacterium agricola]UYW01629.1 hypothetical protein K5I29_01510 [Flavobacterium agricola]